MQVGSKVKIIGMTKNAKLNGTVGTVTAIQTDRDPVRWVVSFFETVAGRFEKKTGAFKRENIALDPKGEKLPEVALAGLDLHPAHRTRSQKIS